MATLNEWLSIDKASGTGNAYVTLTASSYQEMQDRTASLSVKTESEEVLMTVIQKAFNGAFWITKNLISSEWEGGDFTTEIFSAYATLWYSKPDWVTVNFSKSDNKRTVTITIQPNLTDEIRTGKIVFKASSNGSVLGEITLVQSISAEENNIIFYTSTNGSAITPYSSTGLISNTYENGVGMLHYGETVTKIPNDLFRSKTALQSISMPPSVTEVGGSAFYGCTNLSSVDFSENITTINGSAFYGCTALKNIELPSELVTLGDSVFRNCNGLANIVLPSNVKSLGGYCFSKCHLTSITFNEGIKTINGNCFEYNDFTEIVIPDSYTGDLAYVFQVCNNLTKVTLSQNMTSIGQSAFYNSRGLTSITIPSKITSIGKQSFYYCPIVDVYIEDRDTLLTIQSDSFQNNSSLFNAYVPNLRSWLYVDAQYLTNPSSGGGVRNLYVDGELLTEFVLPLDFNGEIQNYAFYKNPHIVGVYLNGECTVTYYSFCGLSNCSHLVLGADCNLHSSLLFSEIEGVLEVYCDVEDSVTFSNCSFQKVILNCDGGTFAADGLKTKELIVNGNEQTISGFSNSKGILDTVTFNGTNITVGQNCFQSCSLIREVDFTKVGFIGSYAFDGTNITEIKGLDCRSVGSYAFNSTPLTYVELYENGMSLDSYVFRYTNLKHIKMLTPINENRIKHCAYIYGNTMFNTKVKTHRNLEIDFWWKNNASHTGDAWYPIIGAGSVNDSSDCFELRFNSTSYHTLQFRVGSSSWTFDIPSGIWMHFVINNKGLWLNDEKKISFDDYPSFTVGEELYINGVGYRFDRNANGNFTTFTIDGVDFIPTVNGFINGSTNELLENVGSEFDYSYKGVISITEKPTINNYTFNGVPQYGFLEYPKNSSSYSDWLSTNSYYLGYYKWNNITIPTDTLDFGVQDTYEITIENGMPSNWEITSKPFWVNASVMSGGEGTTTVTFTKTCDYVGDGDIVITIMGVNYVIPAKAPYIVFDLTEENNFTANVTINGLSSKTYTINNGNTWDSFTIDGDNITITKIGDLYTPMTIRRTITTTDGEQYVIRYRCDVIVPLPKADNRIYYVGSLNTNTVYGTNAEYVGSGSIGGGCYYFEYDRPIIWLSDEYGRGDDVKRLGLPSSLLYIKNQCFNECSVLEEIDFGGNEKFIGANAFGSCPNLSKYILPKTVVVYDDCCFSGHFTDQPNGGAEVLTFGADVERIEGTAFGWNGNIREVNFLGMTPPTIAASSEVCGTVDGLPFMNLNCTFNAPIGADYSSIEERLGITFNYVLEAEERTTYEESFWLDGNQTNMALPESNYWLGFYNAETKQYSWIICATTPENTGNTNISKSYQKNGITTYYDVRWGSGYGAIKGEYYTAKQSINRYGYDNHIFVTLTGSSYGYKFTYGTVQRSEYGNREYYFEYFSDGFGSRQSDGTYKINTAGYTGISLEVRDRFGRWKSVANKSFIQLSYRTVTGAKPSLTYKILNGFTNFNK